MFTIDDAQEILDDIANNLPKDFYKELNGGILLLPEAKESPYSQANDLWIMGEYCVNSSMGRMIKIYYGSFERNLPQDISREVLRDKLKEVLVHEFTHHLESLAGERGLEIWDEEQLNKYFNNL